MIETVKIFRQPSDDKQTLGTMYYKNKPICRTLELAWVNNNSRVSCVPKGIYKVVRRNSAKYGDHFWITNVPNRDMILIHNANYHYQLLGCIAVGIDHIDINKDGYLDVTSSKPTMDALLKTLPREFNLEII